MNNMNSKNIRTSSTGPNELGTQHQLSNKKENIKIGSPSRKLCGKKLKKNIRLNNLFPL